MPTRKRPQLGFLVKFPEPDPAPPPSPCLSRKRGGGADCRSYCMMYEHPPTIRGLSLLCSGGGLWPACTDYETCRQNLARVVWTRREPKGPEAEAFDTRLNRPRRAEALETERPIAYIDDPEDLDFE